VTRPAKGVMTQFWQGPDAPLFGLNLWLLRGRSRTAEAYNAGRGSDRRKNLAKSKGQILLASLALEHDPGTHNGNIPAPHGCYWRARGKRFAFGSKTLEAFMKGPTYL